MGYTYDQLRQLEEAYGMPGAAAKAAPAFGVPVPDAPVPPPPPLPLPPAEEPVLLAGRLGVDGPPGKQSVMSDVPTGIDAIIADAARKHGAVPPARPAAPPVPASIPLDQVPLDMPMQGMTDAAARKQGWVPPAPQKPPQAQGADADLAAAQALEAKAMGGPSAGPQGKAPAGMSPAKALDMAYDMTGERDRQMYKLDEKLADAHEAQVGIKRVEGDASRAQASVLEQQQAAFDDNNARMMQVQADRERAFKDYENRIEAEKDRYMKAERTTTGQDIGMAFSYALAAIGQAFSAAGGMQTDYIGNLVKMQTASAQQRYETHMNNIRGMRVSQEKKDELADKALSQFMARNQLLKESLAMAAEREKMRSGGAHSDAQAEALMKANAYTEAGDKFAKDQALAGAARAIKAQSDAAAMASFGPQLNLKTAEESMQNFVPTGGGGRGFVATSKEGADKARTALVAATELNELYDAQKADVAKLKAQGLTDRMGNAIAGDTALTDRIKSRELAIAAKQNVLQGGGAMSKDEVELQLELRAKGDPTSLRGGKLDSYIENVSAAQKTMDSVRTRIAQTHAKSHGSKQMLPDGRVIFVPEAPGQTLPAFAGPQVSKKR